MKYFRVFLSDLISHEYNFALWVLDKFSGTHADLVG